MSALKGWIIVLRKLSNHIRNRILTWLLPDQDPGNRNLMKVRLDYLEYQVSRIHQALRHLSVGRNPSEVDSRQTRESFNFQWEEIPEGRFMIQDDRFKKEVTSNILRFTGLSDEWFRDKKVLDAGCGQGRYTWGLCRLGARVTAMDISESGLRRTRENCSEFTQLKTLCHNLLKPLPPNEDYDLIWSFGVLHHTGDTYQAFRNIAPHVRPGGYFFLMLYGEPRREHPGDYAAVNEYERLRYLTRSMDFASKIRLIEKEMDEARLMVNSREHVHGYFDAISPAVNDLYDYSEIEAWLTSEGFENIRRTLDDRNHHIIARRKASCAV